MQSVCKVRSRLEGFLGRFFLATAGILATGPQRHDGTGLHGGAGLHGASWRHRTAQDSSASTAAQDSSDFSYTDNSATALATALATGFSSNSYVFL